MNNIKFKKEEIEKFEGIQDIEVGGFVRANENTVYDGLIGTIIELRYGEEKETDNDSILEIIVDFEEKQNMDQLYPELNGTSVKSVIMGEDDLHYYDRSMKEITEYLM